MKMVKLNDGHNDNVSEPLWFVSVGYHTRTRGHLHTQVQRETVPMLAENPGGPSNSLDSSPTQPSRRSTSRRLTFCLALNKSAQGALN